MKIIVTGGAGFIGSHLVAELLRLRHDVYVIDNLSSGVVERIPAGAHFFQIDICDYDAVLTVFQEVKPTAVFHLAAQISVLKSMEDPKQDVEVNVLGTINVALAATKAGASRFIFSSSGGAQYGECLKPALESTLPRPASPYGVSKVAAESYLQVLEKSLSLSVIVLRYSNVFGPGQELSAETGVIGIYFQRLLSGNTCVIYGDGTASRDYVYVHDVVQANILALQSSERGAFNISSGVAITTAGVYAQVATVLDSSLMPAYEPSRPGEILHSLLNSDKARKVLGWNPNFNLESGLTDMYKVVTIKRH